MALRTSRIASILALVLAVACGDSPIAPPASDGGSLAPAAVVAWKGYVWTTTAATTAVVDGDDNLVLTRVAAGDVGVQIAAFDPSINASGTPWMLFSYVDDGTSVQGYDLFVNYNSANARLSGGSLFSCDGLGYERFGVPAQEDFLFAVNCGGTRSGGDHTVYFGERADGTVDAIFDGGWWQGDFLKENGQAPFAYTQVLLRVRGGAIGSTYVFTDFRAGDNHPGGGNKNACKGGGWSDSGLWKNQGSCIQYANTGDKKASEISGS
jgi:hypothetical protein